MSKPREYETTWILAPNTDESHRNRIQERIDKVFEEYGAVVHRIDDWGKRELAYPVRKFSHGVYVHARFAAPPEMIHELERVFRLLDGIIKFLTIKLEDEVLDRIQDEDDRRTLALDDDDDDDDEDEEDEEDED